MEGAFNVSTLTSASIHVSYLFLNLIKQHEAETLHMPRVGAMLWDGVAPAI